MSSLCYDQSDGLSGFSIFSSHLKESELVEQARTSKIFDITLTTARPA